MSQHSQKSIFEEEDDSPWQQVLLECRANFGRPPRSFTRDEKDTFLMYPSWLLSILHFRNPLLKLMQNSTQLNIFQNGHVVWGHVIQANGALYETPPSLSDEYDCPGELVFPSTPQAVVAPEYLAGVAQELQNLRRLPRVDPDLQEWADYLKAETTRVFGKVVPRRLSPATGCMVSTTMFQRRHLPEGKISNLLMPIIVAPEKPHYAMVLPQEFWPEQLVQWWTNTQISFG